MSHHIVRPKDLVQKTGLSRSTLRRMEIAGTLPPRVKLGAYCVGWHSTDVEAWLNSLPRVQQTGGPMMNFPSSSMGIDELPDDDCEHWEECV